MLVLRLLCIAIIAACWESLHHTCHVQPCARLPGTMLQENGHIFEGLRTIAAYYLRADSCSICECIQTFALNDLLFSIARLECAFKKTLRSGRTSPFGEPVML